MKKFKLITMLVVLVTLQAWANPVDESSAQTIVMDYLVNTSASSTQSTSSSSGVCLQLVHTEKSSINVALNAYYIYNTGNGFVIVAGDDQADQILAHGDRDINMNCIPSGMQFMLDMYKERIDYLLEHPGIVPKATSFNSPLPMATSVAPLLKSSWDQGTPYNNMCPFFNINHCMAGCSAVALAQVMYYWKYPDKQVPGFDGYTTTAYSDDEELDVVVSPLSPTTFDWDNMIDSYSGSYTTAQADAVALLMRYVGQAETMKYSPYKSGSSAGLKEIVKAAKSFGYSGAHYCLKMNYTDELWHSLIQSELKAKRPIIYYCNINENVVHAFNVDGFDACDRKYHINWGWGGNSDGYYCIDSIYASKHDPQNRSHKIIVGLESPEGPKPESNITVNVEELFFEALTGQTVTKTFAVMGSNLTNDLTLTLNDTTGNFSIDKNSITVDEATNGTHVTVTYHSTVISSANASVTISGGGADSKTVVLHGNATDTPVINVDVDEVTFEPTYTGGYTSSSTITITGAVNENIQLSWWHGQRASFSLSKETITPEEAAVGAKVTICFCPERWNSATFATLVISSEGAETVSIPVRGTKINSTGFIIASPSDLSFETQVGVPVSKTFRLYYSQSDGNSCIMVSRPGGDSSTGDDGGNSRSAVYDKKQNTTLNNFEPEWFKFGLDVGPHVVLDDSLVYFIKGLKLMVTGDACFSTGTSFVLLTQLSNGGYDVTVTYNPTCAGEHEAAIEITLNSGYAKPFIVKLHGSATEMDRCPSVPNIGDVTNLIDTQLNVSRKPSRDNVDSDVQVNISEVIPLVDQILYRKPQ